jgi:hypothetical protein
MKTKPQDGARSVFIKSSADKMDLTDAIERYSSEATRPEIGITFIGSEAEFERLSRFPKSPSHRARFCSSLSILLRSGLYQDSNLVVLPGPTHVAEQSDLEQILSTRSEAKTKVVVLPEDKSVDWTREIESAVKEIELWVAIKSITMDVLNRSEKISEIKEDRTSGSTHNQSEGLRSKHTTDTLSEEEFKEIIAYKLNQHLKSSPEDILSKAIDIIKN